MGKMKFLHCYRHRRLCLRWGKKHWTGDSLGATSLFYISLTSYQIRQKKIERNEYFTCISYEPISNKSNKRKSLPTALVLDSHLICHLRLLLFIKHGSNFCGNLAPFSWALSPVFPWKENCLRQFEILLSMCKRVQVFAVAITRAGY